jgi:uncharacterized protein
MVRQPCAGRLGVLSDYPKRLHAHHVASGLSECVTVRAVMERLTEPGASALHEFWPDDISLLDARIADAARIHGPRQLTDVYLLVLAVRNSGHFVTLDTSVSLDAVRGAKKTHVLTL